MARHPAAQHTVRIMTHETTLKRTAAACRRLAVALFALSLSSCTGLALSGVSGAGDFAGGIPATLPDLSQKNDGTYEGSYTIGVPPGVIVMSRNWEVSVTVAGGKMTGIRVTTPESFPDKPMMDTMKARMLEEPQSLDVDAFSGATWSSKAFCKAVENALDD